MESSDILPGTGRWQREALTEGAYHQAYRVGRPPSTPACGGGPPPRAGEDFRMRAARLSGQAGVVFGWTPDVFWAATPAELVALVQALSGAGGGEDVAPPDAATLARMMEAFPDG